MIEKMDEKNGGFPECKYNICGGSGWVRKNPDLEYHEDGFGKVEPCKCGLIPEKPKPKPKKKPEPKEPEPVQEEMEFGWEEYTNYDDPEGR